MKYKYIKTIILLLFSKLVFSQFSYKELLDLSSKSKEDVTNYLNTKKKGWVYLKYDKATDCQIWKKGNEKLILNYYSSKSRIIKYYFHNSEYNKKMSSELGTTGEYSFPETVDYDNESLKIFRGPKIVVIHIICSATDKDCNHQIDVMSKERFKSEKY